MDACRLFRGYGARGLGVHIEAVGFDARRRTDHVRTRRRRRGEGFLDHADNRFIDRAESSTGFEADDEADETEEAG